VRAFLTKAEAVAEAVTAKDKILPGARHVEAGTLQNIPSQGATYDHLKIPTRDDAPALSFERDELNAPRPIPFGDDDIFKSCSDVAT
jgi:hypothetical protein